MEDVVRRKSAGAMEDVCLELAVESPAAAGVTLQGRQEGLWQGHSFLDKRVYALH